MCELLNFFLGNSIRVVIFARSINILDKMLFHYQATALLSHVMYPLKKKFHLIFAVLLKILAAFHVYLDSNMVVLGRELILQMLCGTD
jgi:hypothetical protein